MAQYLRLRKDLAWIHDVVRVQRRFNGAHHGHCAFASLRAQEVHFVQANAVLTRARTA